MSHNYYSEINLHLNWHTKENLPLLTERVEHFVYRYLKQKIVNTPAFSFMRSAEPDACAFGVDDAAHVAGERIHRPT